MFNPVRRAAVRAAGFNLTYVRKPGLLGDEEGEPRYQWAVGNLFLEHFVVGWPAIGRVPFGPSYDFYLINIVFQNSINMICSTIGNGKQSFDKHKLSFI